MNKVLKICFLLVSSSAVWAQGQVVYNSENQIEDIINKRDKVKVFVLNQDQMGGIDIPLSINSSIQLLSMEGTYVGTWNNGTQNNIQIEYLPKGTYFGIVTNGLEEKKIRIVVF